MNRVRVLFPAAAALTSLLVMGCESSGGTAETAILFSAKVGGQPFDCATTYSGMGVPTTSWAPKDFRFYVHDVSLLDAAGAPVATEGVDGPFQRAGVTLLDFENKSADCANGTVETNAVVAVRAPAGPYSGLHFKVGVPFEQNHGDVSTAAAPLNVSAMFWNWQGGYKFIKVDGNTAGLPNGYNIHIGSTGCDGDTMGHVTTCARPNLVEVSLTGFDPTKSAVVADLGALVATATLDTNTMDTPPGCMSTPDDPECAPIFAQLGLPFGAAAAQAQAFFRAP